MPISTCVIPARTTRIATKTGTGNESQSAAVFRSEVASERIDAAKYRLSGMTAIAVKRCNRHSRSPSRALPNWLTVRGTGLSRSAVASEREVAFVIGAQDLRYLSPAKHINERRS